MVTMEELDAEWILLIREALDMGLKYEEISEFFRSSKEKSSQK